MIDITPIINAMLALITALITAFLIPWLKGRIDEDKLAQYKDWAIIAVKAAEQIYAGSGRGEEKKKYVIEFLESKGFTIDFDSIDKMIESAVLDLNRA